VRTAVLVMRIPFTVSKLLLSSLLLAPLSLPAFSAPVVYNVTADLEMGPASQRPSDNYALNLFFGDSGGTGQTFRYFWNAPVGLNPGGLEDEAFSPVASVGENLYRLTFQATFDTEAADSLFRLTQDSETGFLVFSGPPGSAGDSEATTPVTLGSPFGFVGGAYGFFFTPDPGEDDVRFTLNLQAVVAGGEVPELDRGRAGLPLLFCGVLLGVLSRRRSG
jgi:hypothetical protein